MLLRRLVRLLIALCIACSGAIAAAADGGCCDTGCVDAWSCMAAPCQACAAPALAPLPAAGPLTQAVGGPAPSMPAALSLPAPLREIWTPPD